MKPIVFDPPPASPLPLLLQAACLLALTLSCLAVLAAPRVGTAEAQARARYQREQVRCMSLSESAGRADCLSESSTALAAALPPLRDPDPGRYARNALERCKPLSEPDRGDCLARIGGAGTISGSVAGGGLYRELVTREVTREVSRDVTPAASAASR